MNERVRSGVTRVAHSDLASALHRIVTIFGVPLLLGVGGWAVAEMAATRDLAIANAQYLRDNVRPKLATHERSIHEMREVLIRLETRDKLREDG